MSKKFPDLNEDGKITKADVLIGRGVIKASKGLKIEQKPVPTIDDLPPNKPLNEVPFIKMKDPLTGKDFILDTRPDRPEKKLKKKSTKPQKKRFGGMAIQGVKENPPLY